MSSNFVCIKLGLRLFIDNFHNPWLTSELYFYVSHQNGDSTGRELEFPEGRHLIKHSSKADLLSKLKESFNGYGADGKSQVWRLNYSVSRAFFSSSQVINSHLCVWPNISISMKWELWKVLTDSWLLPPQSWPCHQIASMATWDSSVGQYLLPSLLQWLEFRHRVPQGRKITNFASFLLNHTLTLRHAWHTHRGVYRVICTIPRNRKMETSFCYSFWLAYWTMWTMDGFRLFSASSTNTVM